MHNHCKTLDMIESRLDSLNRILGPLTDNEGRSENLTDSLISANTLLQSATNGRENINKAITRRDELERYLDPGFLDEKNDIKAKEVYVNTIAPELAENFEILEQVKNLEPALGAEYFCNIPDVTDKLKAMSEVTTEQGTKNDLLEESLIIAMQRYSEIQEKITDSLKDMNDRLDKIDAKLKQKKNEE